MVGLSLVQPSILSYSGAGSHLEGTSALKKDAEAMHVGVVLILPEVKVVCHQLSSALALTVPTGCQCRKAIAHNLLADTW